MRFAELTSLQAADKQAAKQVQHIQYGVGSSPFGEFLLARTPVGICRASFAFEHNLTPELEYLHKHWPNAELVAEPSWVQAELDAWFKTPPSKPVSLHLAGTEFQLAVWQALLDIPFGQTSTYQQIAEQVGRPKAFRAVGTAVGQNPITYWVPCHRVLQSGGGLGGYFWGLELKRALLAFEATAVTGL